MRRYFLTFILLCSVVLPSLFGIPYDRPTSSNTGPLSPLSELRSLGNTKITVDGTVLKDFRLKGTLEIQANNVRISNFVIDGGSAWYGIRIASGTGAIIENGSIVRSKSAAIYGSNFTARRLHIHHVGKDAIKLGSNVTLESNYIHHVGDPGIDPSVHADAIQSVGGSDVLIRWNNINTPIGHDGYLNHHAIIIQTQYRAVDNVRIEENWLNGGGYTVQLRHKTGGDGGEPTNCLIANNLFGPDASHGPWHTTGDVAKFGNRYLSSNSLISGQSEESGSPPPAPTDPEAR